MTRVSVVLGAMAIVAGSLLVGCGSSQKAVQVPPENRELSLKHFLDGSLHDQKGEYAQAILEYEEALRAKQDPAIYHAMAKDFALLGKLDRAVENGKQAIALDPDNRTYRETLAEIYVSAMDYDSAATQLEAAIRIDSSYREGWTSLAHLTQMKDPQRALRLYKSILARFGPDQDTYFQMARIYESLNDLAEATEAVRGMLSLDPGNFEIKKMLADFYLRRDSVDRALQLYNDLVELQPGQIELRAAIAHAYLVKQDYQHAMEQFDIVLKKDTLSADEQIRFGQVFVSFIQKDSLVAPYAITMFRKIRSNYPDDWRSYWFLGAIYNVMKNDTEALANFQTVKKLVPDNPDGWLGIAGVYYDRGDMDTVIALLTEAVKYVPDEFRVHFLLGLAHQRKNELPDAAEALEKALQLNGKNVDAISALALVYDQMKRKDDSDSLYEHALQIDPHNHLVLNNYSYSLAERGRDLERALKMSKEAIELQPTNQSYLDTYGWIFYQMGRYEESEKYISRAVDLGNASSVLYEHLGDVNFRLSHREKAIECWKKALELDPTNETLKGKVGRGSL